MKKLINPEAGKCHQTPLLQLMTLDPRKMAVHAQTGTQHIILWALPSAAGSGQSFTTVWNSRLKNSLINCAPCHGRQSASQNP